MNQRFDQSKLTLVDFNPDAYLAATEGKGQENTTPMTTGDAGAAQGTAVSKGRVTLRLSDLAQTEVKAPPPPRMERTEPRPTDTEPPTPRIEPRPTHNEPTAARPEAMITEPLPINIEPTEEGPEAATDEPPTPHTEPRPYPLPDEGVYILPPLPTAPVGPNGEYPTPNEGVYLMPPSAMATTTPRTEAAAALHVRAIRQPKPKKAPAEPTDMIPINLRVPLYIKDAFFKACDDKGTTPSNILRNFMKSYSGM